MIRFGPAGIPLSCKGRTIRDGIEDIHAPYYMDFLGNGYMRNKSKKFLEFAGEVGNKIGARNIVTHIGPYHGISSEEAIKTLIPIFKEMRNHYYEKNYSPQI